MWKAIDWRLIAKNVMELGEIPALILKIAKMISGTTMES